MLSPGQEHVLDFKYDLTDDCSIEACLGQTGEGGDKDVMIYAERAARQSPISYSPDHTIPYHTIPY